MKIKTLIDKVGIRGEKVAKGTEIEVVEDGIHASQLPDGAIRKAVAVGLVERKAAEVVKDSTSPAKPATK